DPQYIARLIEAARADGWSVPDQPGTVERIVKQPADSASYQSPGDGSHWNLSQRDVEAMVADMKKYGVPQEKIDAALKADGFTVQQSAFVPPEDAEWAAANGTVP